MNRKIALYTLAAIEGILNILIIVLFVMQELSLTGFLICICTVTLVTVLGIIIINNKTV